MAHLNPILQCLWDIRCKRIRACFFRLPGEKFDENWRINHQYTYDVKVPMSRAGDIYTIMQRDLERYFGLKAEVKILKTDCWVLEPLDRRLFISTRRKSLFQYPANLEVILQTGSFTGLQTSSGLP
jgi:hypothetical protein